MAQREHLLGKFKLCICFIFSIIIGCSEKKSNIQNVVFEKIDVSKIPNDTILHKNNHLKLVNGVCYYNNKPYSGFIKDVFENKTIKSIGSYWGGKQHGNSKTFFENGYPRDERNYKNGLAYGKHISFWVNGNKKSEFNYYNEKQEGIQKLWYESGKPYQVLNYKDDKENGMQTVWRENGKPYINYEVKEGIRYGLRKSALCYTLKNEKLK